MIFPENSVGKVVKGEFNFLIRDISWNWDMFQSIIKNRCIGSQVSSGQIEKASWAYWDGLL